MMILTVIFANKKSPLYVPGIFYYTLLNLYCLLIL